MSVIEELLENGKITPNEANELVSLLDYHEWRDDLVETETGASTTDGFFQMFVANEALHIEMEDYGISFNKDEAALLRDKISAWLG